MAHPLEDLDDVMGLVSVHRQPVLVAMINAETDELKFLHVSEPSPVLEVVPPRSPRTTIKDFFSEAEHRDLVSFRVKYWQHSAVAHAIPVFDETVPARAVVSQQAGQATG
ncbi:hypothetical protein OF385_07055 [Glutamicibacter sp. JL.03c]|uniref:hypothetical protein n=1 Tax=Glutamicibacter sp. JL.03c TaxID=2984842 RepID=UPI0021F7A75F|nr:hypothetical protein [Glutamicibacter sp. JL.03c]UYQ78889.1 hypothetical protein OF385_07055 [Glutamicibacter sp. JL.03c]